MLKVTTLTAVLLSVLFIKLSFAVIRMRRSHRVALGSGGNAELERAIRAQGNFVEYVPLGLILLGCLEINGAPKWLVAIPALTLIFGRLFHAKGINEPPPRFENRIRGMQLTFGTLITLAFLNAGWLLYCAGFGDLH
jgi:uncharacterized membrane protein YecN with MAPEG domain